LPVDPQFQATVPGAFYSTADVRTTLGSLLMAFPGTWQAICKLSASSQQAVARVDGAKVQELLARLDSSKYKERQEAIAELFQLGERVLPPLQKVLANNPPLKRASGSRSWSNA
jgi:hypothetical protein